jgi:hypothetical protein
LVEVVVVPSKRANHYGTQAEYQVVDEYTLTLSRSSWHDARFRNGTPVEIKACAVEHADGATGNFKLYETYHRKLGRSDGWYAFAVYRRDPFGVLKTKLQRHADLPLLSWHGGGDHRGTRQAKLYPSEVF